MPQQIEMIIHPRIALAVVCFAFADVGRATPPLLVNLRDHLIGLDLPPALPPSALHRPRPHSRLPAPRRIALGRHLLQSDFCDVNQTLVGSECVCDTGFFREATPANSITVGSTFQVCSSSVNTAVNLARKCGAGGNSACATAYSTNSNGGWGYRGPGNCNDGDTATSCTTDALSNYPNYQPRYNWWRVDLGASKAIGGGIIYFPSDGWALDTPAYITYFELWVGDNPVANGVGNTMCYANADHTFPAADVLSLSFTCLGGGKYAFVKQAGPDNNAINFLVFSELELYPPTSCTASPLCASCPQDYSSLAGALSASDCFVSTGVAVNQTINSVDPYFNDTYFADSIPDNVGIISFASDMEVFLENCPAGYYCLNDNTVPVPCPPGTYRDAPGAQALGDCFPCVPGSYCPIASPYPTYCPAGTYRGTQGGRQPSDCTQCLSGNFCPLGAVDPANCSAGTYRATAGADASNDCLPCPAGEYCGVATTTPTDCSAGSFRGNTGGVTQSDCLACSDGDYCPAGTVVPIECPAGTYRSTSGAAAEGDCTTCPAGSYCPIGSSTPASCAAGTFRGTASGQSQADCSVCPTGAYCVEGTVTPANCPAGTYRTNESAVASTDCVACTEGYFCLVGTTTPAECPAGTYRDIVGATQSADCFICPSGQFCPTAAVTPTSCLPGTYRATTGAVEIQDCIACPLGDYCPFATTTPLLCPAGTYLGTLGGVDRSSCVTCPTGSYCVEESSAPVQCPAGTYRASVGGVALASCVDCPYGQYCPLGTTTPTSCPAGTYLNATNGISSGDCVACPAGQYCPLRSTVPIDCAAGTYRGTTGGVSQAASCSACPSGNYCPLASVTPVQCSAGSYRAWTGASLPEECVVCPTGRYCPVATTNPISCQAGSYRTEVGAAAQSDCSTCPAGAYCPTQSVTPTLCRAGTHRATPGATQLSNCLLCLPGTYATDVGRVTNCPVCDANYYCRTSTLREACPMHTISAAASYSRLNCRCTPGYSCTYYKQIQAIVTLNATIYEFNNDVGGVKTAFLSAMAAAANVTSDHVVINGVVSHVLNPLTGNRRLLSADMHSASTIAEEFATLTADDSPPAPGARTLLAIKSRKAAAVKPQPLKREAIRVFVSVNGSGRLHQLDKQLAKRSTGLHLESRWEQSHKVRADKIEDPL